MLNNVNAGQADAVMSSDSPYENGNADQTFDNMDSPKGHSEGNEVDYNADDAWLPTDAEEKAAEVKAKAKEKAKDAKEKLGSEELKLLSDSDGTETKESAKKPKKEEKADEEKETQVDAGADTDSEGKALPADSKGKLRLRVGGELYGIGADASARIKIDGAYEDVPLQKIISEYSGKSSLAKELSDIGRDKKSFTQEREAFQQKQQQFKSVFDGVMSIVQDPTKDPMDAVNLLVDMAGLDGHSVYKRSIESRLQELSTLLDMSDVEREAHFLKKENEYVKSRLNARSNQDKTVADRQQFRSKVDGLRQTQGVTEDAYVDAVNELEELYRGQEHVVTPELVVEYAANKPHLEKAKELVLPYMDEIGQQNLPKFVTELATLMKVYKQPADKIAAELKAKYAVPERHLRDLSDKIRGDKRSSPKYKEQEVLGKLSSFDDLLD